MPKRYVSIWFRYLLTDWKIFREKSLKGSPVAFMQPDHGRMLICAFNTHAEQLGLRHGMTSADAKVLAPGLRLFEDKPGHKLKLLKHFAEWFLRYTPHVMIDAPDGLLLDVTGCTHLKGDETAYLKDIVSRLRDLGYSVRPGMADTIGCAWAVAHCAETGLIVPPGGQRSALVSLPPVSLRLTSDLLIKLNQLGFYEIGSFIHMPKSVLRRRFGNSIVLRLYQALGQEPEFLIPLQEPVPYSERYPMLEPIRTREAIEVAVHAVIDQLCKRLYGEGLGLRTAILTYLRIDGKSGQLTVGTNHPSQRTDHVFKLFQQNFDQIEPALGIELFILDATKTEAAIDKQSLLWCGKPDSKSEMIAELLDNIAARVGAGNIHRYLPQEHYVPERVAKNTQNLSKNPEGDWREDKPRPIQFLDPPEPIEAMALTPDYPPRQFIYRRERHIIANADGPERIECEWWEQPEGYRDYFAVEDEDGKRYWIFSTPDLQAGNPSRWFLHGYFP
ncbi:MAG: Y-family DNA polymerase [Mucilaginibacter sp.]